MSASQQLLLGGKQVAANYIEDVFSTYLYTGNGSTQTINNGIDLAGKGGMVWAKARSSASYNHALFDTLRGGTSLLSSNNTTSAQVVNGISAFLSNGFTTNGGAGSDINATGQSFASWTFRKQPKFFDVVTYTGNGVANRAIAHSLGSAPGCVIVKQTSGATGWCIWHRGLTAGNILFFDTSAQSASTLFPTDPTSTSFNVNGSLGNGTNGNGLTYVAYLFAHDAGGFGATGTDNVVSCGSMVTSTPLVSVNLGYEPQWVMWKRTDATGNWGIADNMRGMPVSGDDQVLIPNLSNAESLGTRVAPNATGFTFDGGVADGSTFIYIAIRRGPMKVPTDGTKVFKPNYSFAPSPPSWHSDNFPVDMAFWKNLSNGAGNYNWGDRLRGKVSLSSNLTDAEVSNAQATFDYQEGWYSGSSLGTNYASWMFRRAPGFFDEVCYTGTGTTLQTLNHNLTVQPELIIIRKRSLAQDWRVASTKIPNPSSPSNPWWDELFLNTTGAVQQNVGYINNLAVTTFQVAGSTVLNQSGTTYVTYLFATCPGVSKVFSFTGNGTTQTINCGFTGGARFVLLKASSATGGWFVYDTARGMTTLTDPYLQLNSTAAEVATLGSVTTVTTGFAVNEAITTGVNTNGVSYIGLAIA